MEEFTVPFLYDSGKPVDSGREEAEVLAKAFNDSSGSYFSEYKRLGDEIQSAKEKFQGFLVITILFMIGFTYMAITSVSIEYIILLLLGVISFSGATYYFHRKKKKKEASRMNLKPEEDISFLSKMYIPVYIAPYSNEKSLVIDSREMGESVEVELENYDTRSLISSLNEFNEALEEYSELIGQKEKLSSNELEELDEDFIDEKIIEKDLLTALDKIDRFSSPELWEKNSFQLNVHKPKSDFNEDLKYLYDFKEDIRLNHETDFKGYKSDSSPDIPSLDIFTYSDEAIEKIDELKGMEARASSSDILDKTKEWRSLISDIIRDIEIDLENSIEIADSNYDSINSLSSTLVDTQVCPRCLSSMENDDSGPTRGEPVQDYFNLEKYILNEFETPIENMDDNVRCEECNSVLEATDKETIKCPECNSKTIKYKSPEGSPRDKAEKYIRKNINVTLDDIPMKYIFNLPVCRFEDGNWYCEKHGKVEPINLPAFGEVLAPTAEKTWDEMKRPIKNQCSEAKEKAMDHLNQYRSQMLQVSAYEQTEIELESLISQIDGDIRAARTAMEKLGWASDLEHSSVEESSEKIAGVGDALEELGVK